MFKRRDLIIDTEKDLGRVGGGGCGCMKVRSFLMKMGGLEGQFLVTGSRGGIRLPPLWPGFDSRTWCHMWL